LEQPTGCEVRLSFRNREVGHGEGDMDAERQRRRPAWLRDAERLDLAVYAAIAATPTPALDAAMRRLTRAADYSRLSLAAAGVLGATRGRTGRRAALGGMASVGVTAVVLNLGFKGVGRSRPDPVAAGVPLARQVRMPLTTSFPSGHAAAAFAFATGVGHLMPREAVPLHGLAALVAYSRVHTGVHYPADVVAGAVVGVAMAQLTARTLAARRA
jgi:undecaprenyl-diphosphatase